MRHDHRRRQDSDLPVAHEPPAAEPAGGDQRMPTRETANELARLRAMAESSTDPVERHRILADIQDRFGNQVASETIAQLRVGEEEDA